MNASALRAMFTMTYSKLGSEFIATVTGKQCACANRAEAQARRRDEMARFVVAGKVDCAAYARAEILADQLKTYLPDFHVHKVYILPLSCYIIPTLEPLLSRHH